MSWKLSSWRVLVLSLAVFGTITICPDVNAQEAEGLSADTLKPSSSPGALFQLTLPTPARHKYWAVGGLVHYGYKPVKRSVTPPGEATYEDYPIMGRVQADLSFAIALMGWLELGLVVPVVAFQHSDADGWDVQTAGIGDPRLEGKALIYDGEKLDVGAGLEFSIPVGHYASSGEDFLGYTTPTAHPELLLSGTFGRFRLALNGGLLMRPLTDSPAYDQKFSATWSVGAMVDIRDFEEFGGVRVGIENNGEVALGMSSLAQMPLEVLAGVKVRMVRDLVVVGGAGMGLTDALGTPLFRVMLGLYYDKVLHACPEGPEDFDGFQDDDKCVDPDNDQDGIPDDVDKCPDLSEDLDGYMDEDGCPEYDNDGDGVPDVVDPCPMLEEDKDGFEDDDGCPEEGPGKATVKITESQLLLSSKVYFDYGKAEIKEVSFGILNKVAETLQKNQNITTVMIEGHTDNEGTEEHNLKLSEERAKAVVDYLIGKSVDEGRLSYKGYGFSVPKASNETEEGRAINRRVEFKIQKDGEPK